MYWLLEEKSTPGFISVLFGVAVFLVQLLPSEISSRFCLLELKNSYFILRPHLIDILGETNQNVLTFSYIFYFRVSLVLGICP